MSLVSGPGRGMASLPAETRLVVDKHVRYIQSLDTVRLPGLPAAARARPWIALTLAAQRRA